MTPLDEEPCLGGPYESVISAHLTAKNIVTVEIRRSIGILKLRTKIEKYEVRYIAAHKDPWVWNRTNIPIILFTRTALGALEAALAEPSIFGE